MTRKRLTKRSDWFTVRIGSHCAPTICLLRSFELFKQVSLPGGCPKYPGLFSLCMLTRTSDIIVSHTSSDGARFTRQKLESMAPTSAFPKRDGSFSRFVRISVRPSVHSRIFVSFRFHATNNTFHCILFERNIYIYAARS